MWAGDGHAGSRGCEWKDEQQVVSGLAFSVGMYTEHVILAVEYTAETEWCVSTLTEPYTQQR